jgi:ribosome recycling factor
MIEEIYDKTEEEMSLSLRNLNTNLDKIRTGRVNLRIFDSILVESYKKYININQLASIVIINNNSVNISPWDKNNLQSINKSIINSNLGVNPLIIDNIIKINFPPMTKERRFELIKNIKKEGENFKINIRNIRREKNNISKKLLKNKKITKDEEKIIQDKIQNITNKFILEVDKCLKKKEIELMKI